MISLFAGNALASNTIYRLKNDLFPQNTAFDPGPRTCRSEGVGHPTRLDEL